jgi:hypothetical protein
MRPGRSGPNWRRHEGRTGSCRRWKSARNWRGIFLFTAGLQCNFDAQPVIPPSRRDTLLAAAGLIWRFRRTLYRRIDRRRQTRPSFRVAAGPTGGLTRPLIRDGAEGMSRRPPTGEPSCRRCSGPSGRRSSRGEVRSADTGAAEGEHSEGRRRCALRLSEDASFRLASPAR